MKCKKKWPKLPRLLIPLFHSANARENARNKIWQLEGYLLKQKLSES